MTTIPIAFENNWSTSLKRLTPYWGGLMVLGLLLLCAAMFVPHPLGSFMLLIFGQISAALGGLTGVLKWAIDRQNSGHHAALKTTVANDTAPLIATDHTGHIIVSNTAFQQFFEIETERNLKTVLDKICSNPAEAAALHDKLLTSEAMLCPQTVNTRKGAILITAQQFRKAIFIFRIARADAHDHQATENQLSLPAFTLGQAGNIISITASCRTFLGQELKRFERQIPEILKSGEQHWINSAKGLTLCRVLERKTSGGHRQIFLFPEENVSEQTDKAGWAFFNELPVPLLKISADGHIVLSNKPARDLLGITTENPPHFSDVVEGLGRSVSQWLQETIEGDGVQRPEFLRVTLSTQERFVQVNLRRVHSKDAVFLIAVMNDATELKTLEAQFVQSQKMQAIGQLAGGVAHDFNNLLTAISGHCDLLLLRHESGDPDHGDLMQIHQNANRAASLVGQLLAFSRKQTLRPEVIDLRDALSDLTHLLNRLVGETVVLELLYDPGLKSIRADRRQLEQVLMNLVVNARDAMPDGGEIKIRTETRVVRQDYTRDRVLVPAGDYVAVSVEDNGVGIPADKLPKVFEPFFTTKRTGEGTGLGLSTAYGIVKQTGGFIFVDSAAGHGTTFTLLFPAYEPRHVDAVQTETPLTPNSLATQEEGIILLVEDEAPVRAFASRALRMKGYTVIEADCAEAALSLLEDNAMDVDLFVTDVVMPGLDGPSWVKQALAKRPDIRVVFVSGYAEEAFSDKQTRIPNSVFLPKPFSLKDLTQTVQAQFDRMV